MLSAETISTIKSTVPLLEEYGQEITKIFYKLLFEANPQLKNIFNMSNQGNASQSRALADAVLAYAANIDNLEVLLPAVNRIAAKHASIGVQSHHYPLVGASLLQAIQQVLSLPEDHPALSAWGEAYQFLAQIFIDTESGLYSANEQTKGGWEGFRTFEIQAINNESPNIQSYILKASDGKAIQTFEAGQYVSVKVPSNEQGYEQIRQYSLSNWSDNAQDSYRITVKNEANGQVSNRLHQHKVGDELLLSPPQGQFTLNPSSKAHIFISSGVGITPLFAMLKQAIDKGMNVQQLQFIECCRSSEDQIFKDELRALSDEGKVSLKHAFTDSDNGDWAGRLNATILGQWLTNKSANIYLCGSPVFMSAVKKLLNEIGFIDEQIHYEVFGPTTTL